MHTLMSFILCPLVQHGVETQPVFGLVYHCSRMCHQVSNLERPICGDEPLDTHMSDEELLDFESASHSPSTTHFEYYRAIYHHIYESYFCILLGCTSRHWGSYTSSNEAS